MIKCFKIKSIELDREIYEYLAHSEQDAVARFKKQYPQYNNVWAMEIEPDDFTASVMSLCGEL